MSWQESLLGEVCVVQRGTMITQALTRPGAIPVVAGGTAPTYFHDEPNRPAGTITISASGANAGFVNFWDQPIFASDCSTVTANADSIDIRFMFHQLRSKQHVINGLRAGAAQPHVYAKDIAKLVVKVPPVSEQCRIAAILDKADALRIKRREVLAQLDRLAQSIFVEMFGDPATNPQGWTIRNLKELGKVSTGGTPPSALDGMFGGEIPFVTPGDLESDKPVKRTVTEAGAQEAGTVRAGATLVCCIGATIGKMGWALSRSAFNQQLNAVEWSTELVDDLYGLAALRFFRPTIIAWGASTTLPILKKSSFEKISIPVPPLALQQEFAKRIQALHHLEAKMRSDLDASTDLFLSLQSRAFQGSL